MEQPVSLTQYLGERIGEGKTYRSNREFADQAGLDEKTVRRIRQGKDVSLRSLKKLADALKLPIEDVQRMAGILPSDPALTPEEAKRQLRLKQLLSVFSRLPESDQAEIMQLATIMAGLSDKNRDLLLSMARTMQEQELG